LLTFIFADFTPLIDLGSGLFHYEHNTAELPPSKRVYLRI